MERRWNLGIDLLRILAALMVVGAHVLGQGGVLAAAWGRTDNSLGAAAMQSICTSCVNCFSLISGYLLCQTRFRLRRLLRLWAVALFYGMAFTALRLLVEPELVSKREFASAIFPITFKRLWFLSAYAGLFFMSPFINRLLRSLSKEQHLALSLVLLALFSLMATISSSDVFGINDRGHNVFWLAVLYTIGAYMRMHGRPRRRGRCALVLLATVAVAVAFRMLIAHRIAPMLGLAADRGIFLRDISPPNVLIALSLFCLCQGIAPRSKAVCGWITRLGAASFGIYAIHMQPMLWDRLRYAFEPIAAYPALLFLPAALGATVGLFAACAALELLRMRLFALLGTERALCALEQRLLALWGWALGTARKVL